MDRLSLHVHGNADSHFDALCHVIYDGTMYNDVAADSINAAARELSVNATAGQGIVGRGGRPSVIPSRFSDLRRTSRASPG